MAVKGLQVAVLLFRSESDKKKIWWQRKVLKWPLAMLIARSGSEGLQGCGNTVSAVAFGKYTKSSLNFPAFYQLDMYFMYPSAVVAGSCVL